jgi:hypothetical protein
MLTLLYHVSLGVICLTALWLALDPRIPTGIVGSLAVGGVAVFSLAATEGDPPNWLVGQMASIAGLCLWLATRVLWRRRAMRKQLDDVRQS